MLEKYLDMFQMTLTKVCKSKCASTVQKQSVVHVLAHYVCDCTENWLHRPSYAVPFSWLEGLHWEQQSKRCRTAVVAVVAE